MKRNWVRLAALAAALSCLGGCAFSSPEELYAVPRAAEDYKNLQDQIDRVRSAGAEYAGPLFGTNTQPIQLMDLDGDGVQEAIAFFRATSLEDPDPLKICIYRPTMETTKPGTPLRATLQPSTPSPMRIWTERPAPAAIWTRNWW